MKLLSIIIVTYHSEKDIYDCLSSVWQFSDIPREDLEVIIVDNSPQSEQMFTKLKELYGNDIILIHNTHNGGYGQGNNVGIHHATAPIVMIMNPDVRLIEPVFDYVLKQFANDPKLGLYGFTQRCANGKIGRSTSWVSWLHPYIAEPLRFITGRLNCFFPKYMYFTGAAFFLQKKIFLKAGLFDEKIFMYGEEEDIHDRVLAIPNIKIKYSRKLNYQHLHNETIDYETESYSWMEKNLLTLCYINSKKGFSKEKVIEFAIKRNNITLLKEYIKYIITNGKNRDRLHYYKRWKQNLLDKIQKS